MIGLLGPHRGKRVVFGFDHHALAEVEAYTAALAAYGDVLAAAHGERPHYLSSTQRVCERVRDRADAVGVLICSTGIGVSIAANKFGGVYAARCLTAEDAELCRTINNANVLCLALRTGLEGNRAVIHSFMTTPYEGRKLEQLARITLLEHERSAPEAARAPAPIEAA